MAAETLQRAESLLLETSTIVETISLLRRETDSAGQKAVEQESVWLAAEDSVRKCVRLLQKAVGLLLEKEREQRALRTRLDNERERLERERQKCIMTESMVQSINANNDNIVILNVGGTVFTTTRQTLCAFPDSMLAAWFSGRHAMKKNENGEVFIDRSPECFRYVLDYCRNGGSVSLPEDVEKLRQVALDFDYYCLPLPNGLVGRRRLRNTFSDPEMIILDVPQDRLQRAELADVCMARNGEVVVGLYVDGEVLFWDAKNGNRIEHQPIRCAQLEKVPSEDGGIQGGGNGRRNRRIDPVMDFPFIVTSAGSTQLNVWELNVDSETCRLIKEIQTDIPYDAIDQAGEVIVVHAEDEFEFTSSVTGWDRATGDKLWCVSLTNEQQVERNMYIVNSNHHSVVIGVFTEGGPNSTIDTLTFNVYSVKSGSLLYTSAPISGTMQASHHYYMQCFGEKILTLCTSPLGEGFPSARCFSEFDLRSGKYLKDRVYVPFSAEWESEEGMVGDDFEDGIYHEVSLCDRQITLVEWEDQHKTLTYFLLAADWQAGFMEVFVRGEVLISRHMNESITLWRPKCKAGVPRQD